MQKLRILAIEDDLLQAELLSSHIDTLGHLLIEVCTKVSEFRRLFLATDPDLLIVDIDLKSDISGIDLIQRLEKLTPTIFLTGVKDQHIIQQAVHNEPIAYITKPYTQADLFAALAIAEKAIKKETLSSDSQSLAATPTSLYIKQNHFLVKVQLTDVYWIEVQEKDCRIVTAQKEFTIKTRLKDLLSKLPNNFIQIHRSYVINCLKLEKLDLKKVKVIIEGQELPIGRNYKSSVLSKLNTFN